MANTPHNTLAVLRAAWSHERCCPTSGAVQRAALSHERRCPTSGAVQRAVSGKVLRAAWSHERCCPTSGDVPRAARSYKRRGPAIRAVPRAGPALSNERRCPTSGAVPARGTQHVSVRAHVGQVRGAPRSSRCRTSSPAVNPGRGPRGTASGYYPRAAKLKTRCASAMCVRYRETEKLLL